MSVAVGCGYNALTGARPLQPGTGDQLDLLFKLDALPRCKCSSLLELILFKLNDLVRVHVLVLMSNIHQVLPRPVGNRVPLDGLLLIALSDGGPPIRLTLPLLHLHGLRPLVMRVQHVEGPCQVRLDIGHLDSLGRHVVVVAIPVKH